MKWIGGPDGFPLRHSWWLERVGHDGARQLASLLLVCLGVLVVVPAGRLRQLSRWQRIEIGTGTALGLLVVNVIKRGSLTSCPWDLGLFGGVAEYVSHWNWLALDGGPGRCFPGGHASAALAFIALVPPLLVSAWPEYHRAGRRFLVTVLFIGLVLGGVQTLRGAHYPSHTLWSAWFCWTTALANHELFSRRGLFIPLVGRIHQRIRGA